MPQLVCVTGATGFAASQVVKDLLSRGYKVHGTCRSLEASKTKHLTTLPHADTHLKLFKAELRTPGSYDDAIAGCVGVFHMASPFFMGPTNNSSVNATGEANNEDNFLIPARDGTLNVFRSCQKAGTVKKVVVTSSTATVYVDYGSRGVDYVYSEKDWSDETKMRENESWYALSKQMAEKAATDFVDKLPPAEKFDLCTIQPTLILGDMIQPSLNESNAIILNFLTGKKALTNESKALVDVEDVSLSHILAYESNETGRFLCIGDCPHWSIVCQSLARMCPQESRIPLEIGRTPPAVMGPQPPAPVRYSCDRLERLGVKFKKVEEMLDGTLRGLVKGGHYSNPESKL